MTILFWILAFIVIVAALSVVVQESPMASALSLVVTMLGLAVLFLMLHAFLLAALQVIVYAGAVMVLFLFVIMMLDLRRYTERPAPFYATVVALLAVGTLLALLYARGTHSVSVVERATLEVDQVSGVTGLRLLAAQLFTEYAYPFELAGLLLLTAMVGLVVLTKRRQAHD